MASEVPIAITKHGQTVGCFIPAKVDPEAEVAALRSAPAGLGRLVDPSEPDVDVIVEEFGVLRHQAPNCRGSTDAWYWMPT